MCVWDPVAAESDGNGSLDATYKPDLIYTNSIPLAREMCQDISSHLLSCRSERTLFHAPCLSTLSLGFPFVPIHFLSLYYIVCVVHFERRRIFDYKAEKKTKLCVFLYETRIRLAFLHAVAVAVDACACWCHLHIFFHGIIW